MTSASELFYQRRSRAGRDPWLALEPSSSSSSSSDHHRYFHHFNCNNHRRRHRRHDPDGFDHRHDPDGFDHRHFRSTSTTRCPHPRPSSGFPAQECPSIQLEQGTSQFMPSNSASTDGLRNPRRPRLTGNDRLPGAVLLARARLLERLRGVSLSESRRNGRASFGTYNREYTLRDELRVVDAGDWGTDNFMGWSNGGSPFIDSTIETERGSYKNKPPGLTSEAVDLLQSELFSSLDKGTESEVSSVSCDCSICLESFSEGDELIRLPCEHRFHFTCLEPWVRTCGDCPNCRQDIVVSTRTIVKGERDPS